MNPARRKMLKITLLGIMVSVVLLIIINRYVFSWTGLISSAVGLCKYKSVAVPAENGYPVKLSQAYDIPQIASVMRTNRNYEINEHYNGNGLAVSRMFNGVKYNVLLYENHNGVTEFNLNTYNFAGYSSGLVTDGERCTTPSYALERNVQRIIDDLPLSDLQKSELKQNIRVQTTIDLKLTF